MKAKKIILVIVEGINDKTCLEYVLSSIFSSENIEFEITNGDITSAKGSTQTNIASKIGNLVRDFSNHIYSAKDYLRIIHIVDTDGAFIPAEKVIHQDIDHVVYTSDSIITSDVLGIRQRNMQKASILNRLIDLQTVWRTIPYEVYYFSSNMDHVFHNNANLSKSEKYRLAEEFTDRFSSNPGEFMPFIHSDSFRVEGDYNSSWNFIKKDDHSLHRHSNFHLIFD